MFRRLINSVMENTYPTTNENFYPSPFTKKETLEFEWLSNVSPCFPINARNIRIITEPQQFYDTLITNCKTAQERITLVSLYLGTGNLEKKLVETVRNNEHFQNHNLKVTVLLDYLRGSRCQINSRTMLAPLLQGNVKNCQVSLYHTPALRGYLRKILPNRFNEIFGLQHMKLYVFDDTLIISGANLSNDYFTNRQDRYFLIKDKRLCDFYCGLVDRVQQFSLQMDECDNVALNQQWEYCPFEGDKKRFVQNAGDLIEEYLLKAKDDQNGYIQDGFDTWVFPLVQMNQLGIDHDAQITNRIFANAPEGGHLHIATGYFNLTKQYMDTLVEKSRATCNILMAHPSANGFLGARGPAGGIPLAYSFIAQQFKQKFTSVQQHDRIKLYEYSRAGWTYHSKGVWYYHPGQSHPCLTLIGSPNYGERSVNKDLETQLAIVTENENFREQLHEECQRLYDRGSVAQIDERIVPGWVRLMVFLFRKYF